MSVARAVQHHGLQPATTALVAAQAAAHFKPGGYRLLQVGMFGIELGALHALCSRVAGAETYQWLYCKSFTTCMQATHAIVRCHPLLCPVAQVGLNAHRVLHAKEWRRLGTSLAVHADLPHLVSNSAALVLEVSKSTW